MVVDSLRILRVRRRQSRVDLPPCPDAMTGGLMVDAAERAALDGVVSPLSGGDVVGAYRDWMRTLTMRADLTLRLRATVTPDAEPRRPVSLPLTEDLVRATVCRAMNRING